MPTPTADEFFGYTAPAAPPAPPSGAGPNQSGAPPTASQYLDAPPPPQAGAAHDAWWSMPVNVGARILNAAGYGIQQAWGSRPLGLNPDDDAALRKAGVLPDYNSGHTTFLQTTSEAILRPAAQLADAGWRALPTLTTGAETGLEQAAEEIAGPEAVTPGGQVRQALATPVGMLADIASGVRKGYYGELLPLETGGAITAAGARSARLADASEARSVGAIGEGEVGFYDATPLTPEHAQARTEAAAEAGIEPVQPEPAPPDVHTLARRIAPETFQEYDALNAEAALHRAELGALGAERAVLPEAVEAQGQIDTILGRVNNVPSRLTNAAQTRLEAAQARLDDILHTDTPEMAAARGRLLDADYAMRDLAPDVSSAYRQARELAPDLPETAAEAEAQPERAAEAEKEGETPVAAEEAAVSQGQARAAAAAGSAPEAEAEVAPGSVTGEEKLGTPQGAAVSAGEPVRAIGEEPKAGGGTPETVRVGPEAEGTGETVTRGLSRHVEETAIARGLVNSFGDLPEYERVSMADQARQAADLIDSDYESAKAVAMGERSPPAGLLPESVFVGVEKRALAEGDVETIRQLATQSRLANAATTMGQRIRTLGEREPSSPVGALQAIQRSREVAFERGGAKLEVARSAIVAEIKAEVRSAATKPDAFRAFLDSLLCAPE